MENITTGNWKADRIIQGHVAVGKLLVASAHCGTTHSSSVGIDAKEMLANAHLIAAAPKMYEVIEKALAIADLWTYPESECPENPTEAQALSIMKSNFEQVLAKARGELTK